MSLEVRALDHHDAPFVFATLMSRWDSTVMVTRGVQHDAAGLPGFVATTDDEPVGLLTYDVKGGALEVVTVDALEQGEGVGRRLLEVAAREAERQVCWRLWLVTTNDNLAALAFFVRCGLRLVAVHVGAVDAARAVKPSIPTVGADGIRIRDEWELELSFVSGG